MAERADRFGRLVLVLPASIDRPRGDAATDRLQKMAAYVEAGNADALAERLRAGQPAGARDRPDVIAWTRRQAHRLLRTPVARALRELSSQAPLRDRGSLAALQAPVLVIGQHGDEAHPLRVAQDLAAALPRARLAEFDDGGLLWTHRRELRDLIAGFLNDTA